MKEKNNRNNKIIVNSGYFINKIFENTNNVEVVDASHYNTAINVSLCNQVNVSSTIKAKYYIITDVRVKVAIFYNKKNNDGNMTKEKLKEAAMNNNKNFSFGSVRGISKRALGEYIDMDYEELVRKIGETKEFYYKYLNHFMEENNIDYLLSPINIERIDLKDKNIKIAKLESFDFCDNQYPLYSPRICISGNNKNDVIEIYKILKKNTNNSLFYKDQSKTFKKPTVKIYKTSLDNRDNEIINITDEVLNKKYM